MPRNFWRSTDMSLPEDNSPRSEMTTPEVKTIKRNGSRFYVDPVMAILIGRVATGSSSTVGV